MIKTSTYTFDGSTVTVTSNDVDVHRLFAQLLVEKIVGVRAPVAGDKLEKAVFEFVAACRREAAQLAILRLLSRTGSASRDDMLKEAELAWRRDNEINPGRKPKLASGTRSLRGCRGGMARRAANLAFPENWWTTAKNTEGVFITTLDPLILPLIRKALESEG